MDVDDYTQPVEAVIAQERRYPSPLEAEDIAELFKRWCELNPQALRDMELTAIAIDARGMRVSAKYLIEKQRYEGRCKLVPVPYTDQNGMQHAYGINNTHTPLIARWLLERHPDMRIVTSRSMFDKENDHEAQ